MPILTGRVRKYIPWNRDQNVGGYGFITDDSGTEYFFHAKYSNLTDEDFRVGLLVKFEIREGFDNKRGRLSQQASKVDRA
ncbi:cold shock domain-containing protein [Leptospira langatensis]|uniref:Cold shock domain-containing protein n=1 Tax=Leptospira langatensis TaxID=2484983 RepID=A0A5R2ATF2_9LEPT|nr:cold shock domain-containing protein [Leptospira langatensis]TGJ99832.1 cold shock domain-containing protein [Leptospira langatensis]